MKRYLREAYPVDFCRRRSTGVDPQALKTAAEMLAVIESDGEAAVRRYAAEYSELKTGESIQVSTQEIDAAVTSISVSDRELLERTAGRIRMFAEAQRSCLQDLSIGIEGGTAGHRLVPVRAAGCYAPGGRYPLPSSVLMTVIPAKVAGVQTIAVSSPNPSPVTLAAAYIAGADTVLRVGGVQAIAAFAFGLGGTPRCDMVVGPGNRFVTAAKFLLSSRIGIDLLAGPSELLVIADESADPEIIAADLLAQAEHDPESVPMLVSLSDRLCDTVNSALDRQLSSLPTRGTAEVALRNGFVCRVRSIEEAARLAEELGPEHLELFVRDSSAAKNLFTNFGGLFIGGQSAEVFGDYGLGPNHVLPTGGTSRFSPGLSVATFLKQRTWMELDSAVPASIVDDCARLARLEALEGHARACERRSVPR